MTRKLALPLAAIAAALALGATAALAATGRSNDDPGVTSTSILLGGTTPLSGPYSALSSVTIGANAYLRYVNGKGGVNGRQISFKYLDDAYNPAQTVQLTRQLVDQDKVFAIFDPVGTEPTLAVRDELNARKVPQLYAASGATVLGTDGARFPYTIGFQPSYNAEGWVYGKYLARTQAGARVAVLFQNDDYGKDLLGGLRKGLLRSKVKVVAAEPYEPTATDVQAQIAKLKASGANVFAIFAAGKFPVQAYSTADRLGWRPKLVVTNIVASAWNVMTLASEGGANKLVDSTISGVFLKDPNDTKWSKDAYHVYGMAVAYTLVEALRKAGKDLTREGLMKVVQSLNVTNNPFVVPGISVKTGPGDRFPIEQILLQRWHKGSWHGFGGVWSYRSG